MAESKNSQPRESQDTKVSGLAGAVQIYLRGGILRTPVALSVISHVWSHPSNSGHRLGAIARAARFQMVGRLFNRPSTARVGIEGRLQCYLHENAASSALYANPADFAEMHFWRRQLRAEDLFVDVGANVGSYAVWAGDCGADVIAIEPDVKAFARLEANLAINDFRITALQCGLGARDGTAVLTADKGTMNHLEEEATDSGPTQTIPMRTLDSVLAGRRARGVKIDVEGAERFVLEGARSALVDHRIDLFQIEWNSLSERTIRETREPIVDLLMGHDYTFFRPPIARKLSRQSAIEYGADIFAASPGVAAYIGR